MDRLATIEVQLLLRCLDHVSFIRFARCSKRTFSDANTRFALAMLSGTPMKVSNTIPSQSLLRHHPALYWCCSTAVPSVIDDATLTLCKGVFLDCISMMSDVAMQHVHRLARLGSIRFLSCESTRYNRGAFATLCDVIKDNSCTQLQELHVIRVDVKFNAWFGNTTTVEPDHFFFDMLDSLPSLQHLTLDSSSFSVVSTSSPSFPPNLKCITFCNYYDLLMQFTEAFQFLNIPSLTQLSFHDVSLDEKAWEALGAKLVKMKNIVSFEYTLQHGTAQTGLTHVPKTMRVFFNVWTCTTHAMESLCFSGCDLGEQHETQIAQVIRLGPRLRHLNLSNNYFTTKSAVQFAQAILIHHSLRTINLTNNCVHDDAMLRCIRSLIVQC